MKTSLHWPGGGAVQLIEAEVNEHWRELLPPQSEEALLTLQLRRMMVRVRGEATNVSLASATHPADGSCQRRLNHDGGALGGPQMCLDVCCDTSLPDDARAYGCAEERGGPASRRTG